MSQSGTVAVLFIVGILFVLMSLASALLRWEPEWVGFTGVAGIFLVVLAVVAGLGRKAEDHH